MRRSERPKCLCVNSLDLEHRVTEQFLLIRITLGGTKFLQYPRSILNACAARTLSLGSASERRSRSKATTELEARREGLVTCSMIIASQFGGFHSYETSMIGVGGSSMG